MRYHVEDTLVYRARRRGPRANLIVNPVAESVLIVLT